MTTATEMLEATADIDPANPHRITLVSTFRCKDAIKAVPGAKWDTDTRQWTVPLTWPACLALRAEFGAGLTIGPDLKLWATVIAPRKRYLLAQRGVVEMADEGTALPGFADLYPFQKVDADSIAWNEGSFLLLNETGAGKSRSALAGLSLRNDAGHDIFPLCIVAPKSMLVTWSREVAGFFPTANTRIIAGTPAKVKKALEPGGDVYIIGWETVRKYSRVASYGSISLTADEKKPKELQALGLQSIVLDECHRAKNPQAKRTRAAWAVAADCTNRIGLTGTPIQDTPEDLYSVLHMLFPDEYPTKTAFVDRYLEIDWGLFGEREIKGIHPDRAGEFFQNFDSLSRRLTKAAVAPWLPEKIFEVRWVTLPPALRKAYDSMEKTLVAELESTTVTAENNLVRAGRLLQLANSSGDLEPDGRFTAKAPSPKIDAFMEDMDGGDFDGEQVVVFSESKQLIRLLGEAMSKAKSKPSYVEITGDVTGDDRQKAMDTFQAGDVQFCLLTRAGGEGITLTAASTMVRLMRSWSLTVHKQVEDRVHRIGSERHKRVRYIDYISEDTAEMGQMVRLNAKEGRSQEVLRDEELLKLIRVRTIEEIEAGEIAT